MPILTLIIACYEMQEQLGNTLVSVRAPYQRDLKPDDVHVVVIDNGSAQPLPPAMVPRDVEYRYIPPGGAAPYPGPAINDAVEDADELIGIMVDGACLLTPGVLRGALDVLGRWPHAIVDAKRWHLGHKPQQDTIAAGGDPAVDQQLLADVRWPEDGYRLFDICAPTPATRNGFLSPANESTGLFTSRELFLAAGGYDERFRTPGGGLANIDLWWRLVATADPVVTLLGEGNFHQAHGGASTGLPRPRLAGTFQQWRQEYKQLTGRRDVGPPPHHPLLVGRLGPAATRVQARTLPDDE